MVQKRAGWLKSWFVWPTKSANRIETAPVRVPAIRLVLVERPPIGPFDEFEPPVHRVPEPRLLDARRHGATEGQRTHEGRNRGSFSLSRHKNAMRGVDAASDNPWPTPWYGLRCILFRAENFCPRKRSLCPDDAPILAAASRIRAATCGVGGGGLDLQLRPFRTVELGATGFRVLPVDRRGRLSAPRALSPGEPLPADGLVREFRLVSRLPVAARPTAEDDSGRDGGRAAQRRRSARMSGARVEAPER